MAVAVEADVVAGSDDLGRELRSALDLLADEEERRPRVRSLQERENRRRSGRMRSVVERERDRIRGLDAVVDPERRSERPEAGRERGQRMRGDQGRREKRPRTSTMRQWLGSCSESA